MAEQQRPPTGYRPNVAQPIEVSSSLFADAWANTETDRRETYDPAIQGGRLSYRPDMPEPAYTFADCFAPPHPLSIPKQWCKAVIEAAKARPPMRGRPNGSNILLDDDWGPGDLDPTIADGIIERISAANRYWWDLDVERWSFRAKQYLPGESMVWHPDLHAHTASLKIAATIQLSAPKYEGGDVCVEGLAANVYGIPRDRGTLLVMPGWTSHRVEPVTEGERWALCVNGHGPRLR